MNKAEQDFASLFSSDIITYPTREQDMFEHWDICVDGKKSMLKVERKLTDLTTIPKTSITF